MDIQTLLSHVDHAKLENVTTWEEVKNFCDDAMKYGCASVCVPPCFVNNSSDHVDGRIKVCTVVGYPLGFNESYIKIDETKFAILDGADEIELSINLCHLKDKRFDLILSEINQIKKACEGKTLKVVVDTSLLSFEETVKIADLVTKSTADFFVTSSADDAEIIAKYLGENIKLKVTCDINTLDEAKKIIELGVERIGSNNMIKLMKQS